jgi:hypothetical protein
MVKVSIEVHDGTARFAVAIKAQSIRQALNIVAARYPSSAARVRFPIPRGFSSRVLLLERYLLSRS